MTKVKKHTGEMEDFDRQKLEQSIVRAGAKPETARQVAERIQPSESMSTEELRAKVADELQRIDPAVSGAYASTRQLTAKGLSDVALGVARVHEDLGRRLGAEAGQNVIVMHGDRRAEARLELDRRADPREIQLNSSDLQRLGVPDGARLTVRFSR